MWISVPDYSRFSLERGACGYSKTPGRDPPHESTSIAYRTTFTTSKPYNTC